MTRALDDGRFPIVADLAAYEALVKAAKAKHKGLATNSFLLPDTIRGYAAQGRLRYGWCGAGLMFLLDMGCYDRLYYYMDPARSIGPQETFDKPVAIEFVMAQGREKPRDLQMAQNWQAAGFRLNTTTRRLARVLTELPAVEPPQGLDIRPARPGEAASVYALWLRVFDPVKNLLPSEAALEASVQAGEVLCAATEDGTLAGVLQAEYGKAVATVWHVAVDPAWRGKGIYWPMLHTYYAAAAQRGIMRHLMWVEESNRLVLETAQRHGYAFDGLYSRQYVCDRP